MKIFYAIQATGNGHISRAMELLPSLRELGTVDIFLSGDNSNLAMDGPVKYRSKGLSLYYNSKGGLDYWKILRGFHPLSLRKQIHELPVEKYDLVINDFEYITSAACARKKIPSIQLGHQASFHSPMTPRPAHTNAAGEWIIKSYAKATHYIGLHFDRYDDFILPPVIKKEILESTPKDDGHITVYFPACSATQLAKLCRPFTGLHFHIFSKEISQVTRRGHISYFPIDRNSFNQSMIHCAGIVCGAGFETPAEALYLGKKLLCIPTRGQYEQLCNAAALEKLGVQCIKKIDENFAAAFFHWLENDYRVKVNYGDSIPLILDRLSDISASLKTKTVYEELPQFYLTTA